MKETLNWVGKKIGGQVRNRVLTNMPEAGLINNLADVNDKFTPRHLEQLGAKPVFIKTGDPSFEEMRHKLNTESGVIICNHPTTAEPFAILSTLKRDDVKVVVAPIVYTQFRLLAPEMTSKYLVSTRKDSLMAFKGLVKHINNGGLVLIFPSGGDNRNFLKSHSEIQFKSGFRFLLDRLDPEQMVYCFNINSEDARDFNARIPVLGAASELLVNPDLNLNRTMRPQVVRMDEAYTRASEWKSAIKDQPEEIADDILAKKYESVFETK